MDRIADRKLHVAPLVLQRRAIDKLLRDGRFRNVTAFVRAAIDHYLDHLGQPTLSQQARHLAEEMAHYDPAGESVALQQPSMDTDESW